MHTRFTRNPLVGLALFLASLALFVAACGTGGGTKGTTTIPAAAPSAVASAASQLDTVLTQVSASPQAHYVLAQVETCPSMGSLSSFFVKTTPADANTVDAQRFAIVRYLYHHSNRVAFYTCLQQKAQQLQLSTAQQANFVTCGKQAVEKETANVATDLAVIAHPVKRGIPFVRSYLLTTLPGCYKSVGGVVPTSASPTPTKP